MLLKDVVGTDRLALRGAKDFIDSASVLAPFASIQAQRSDDFWDLVTRHLLELCKAQSAGISIFADPRHDELTWVSTAGRLRDFRKRRFPRRHSLCGVCLDRRSPQLFINPHLYFQWIAQAGVFISEGLVVPLYSDDTIYGTMWVMAHDGRRHFDLGDCEALQTIAARATQVLAHIAPEPR